MKGCLLLPLLILLLGCSSSEGIKEWDVLEASFQSPPDSVKPGVYWYWLNEHISKEGITKDLEAMAQVGIGEAFIGNIYEEGRISGNIQTLTAEWFDAMRFAIQEGHRLGIKIGLFNSPGWSQSGGPWVTSDNSMRYLSYVSKKVSGGEKVQLYIPVNSSSFQDVATLAYPNYVSGPIIYNSVKSACSVRGIENLVDGVKETISCFRNKSHDSVDIDFELKDASTIRSITIYPVERAFGTTCKVKYYVDGEYKLIKSEYFDRINVSHQLGPTPDGPLVLSFKGVKSNRFRISLLDLPANFEIKEIELSSEVKVEKITEKLLNKLPNTSNPVWNAYVWDTTPLSDNLNFTNVSDIVNVSDYVKNDTLTWIAPQGNWTILRIGMLPTNTTNTPAPPKARGLEIDKMNTKAAKLHFQSFVGKIVEGLSVSDRKAVERLIVDSYEVGPQNWTDDFTQEFKERMGYDPTPWLPVVCGNIVGSEEESNRFLWDLRRVVADLIAERYVGGLKSVAHEHGMSLWLENYGHWGYPSEFLYYGGMSDDIGGEFWAGSPPGTECKAAASAGHIYGKNKIYAESYTSSGNYFGWSPANLKKKGDWSYTEGINQVIMHVYIHQPYEDRIPGVNAWFGIEFNRHNTWFKQAKEWIDYQKRCSFLLQQGIPVNDVCIFIGEDAPIMDGWKDIKMDGYSYDFINSDVIINRLSVKNGKFRLPNGVEYAAMVLPPLTSMRPETLERLVELVNDGGILIGTPPSKSPSLVNYPECDKKVKDLSQELWGDNFSLHKKDVYRQYGKGWICSNVSSVNTVLDKIGLPQDVNCSSKDLKWAHRSLKVGDIYFLSNQGDKPQLFDITFRTSNRYPEIWNPITGSSSVIENYIVGNGTMKFDCMLDEGESCFVVFRNAPSVNMKDKYSYKLECDTSYVLSGKWNIHFVNEHTKDDFYHSSDSLFDWSKYLHNDKIKYFSGTASYELNFEWPYTLHEKPVFLSFDKISEIATIYLNDQKIQTLWTKPYKVNISSFLKKGKNKLRVVVSNLWNNQLVYQAQQPKDKRKTWLLLDTFSGKESLLPSGIKGEVRIFLTH